MNLIWHQFKKDLRQNLILVGAWLGVVLIQTILYTRILQLSSEDRSGKVALESWVMILLWVKSILLYVTTAQLIQAEPLVGTTAFWQTRPLPARALLAAKLLFLGLIVLLPLVVAEVLAFQIFGVSWRYTALMVPELLLFWLAFLIPCLLVACLTRSLSRYALVTIIGSFILILSFPAYMEAKEYVFGLFGIEKASGNAEVTPQFVSLLLIVIGGFTLIVRQYLTRRTVLHSVLAIVLTIVVLWNLDWWHRDYLSEIQEQRKVTFNPSLLPKIEASPNPKLVCFSETRTYNNGDFSLTEEVKIDTLLRTNAPEFLFSAREVKSSFTVGNVTVLEGRKDKSSEPFVVSERNLNQSSLGLALKGIRVLNVPETVTHSYSICYFDLPAEVVRQWKGSVGTLKADINWDVYRYQKEMELPLQKNALWKTPQEQLRVTDVLYDSHGCTVYTQKIGVQLMFFSHPDFFSEMGATMIYLLVNPKRNEAYVANDCDYGYYYHANDPTERLSFQTRRLYFTGKSHLDQNKVTSIPREWLNDAVLVRVKLEKVGEVATSFEVPNFKLGDKK